MKRLLALVSLLTVGLLVGCGGEKPKVVIDPAAKMKELQDRLKDFQKKGIPADDPRMR